MPSVERETVDLVSPPRAANEQRPISDRNDMLREYNNTQSFKRNAYPPVPQSMGRNHEVIGKRRNPPLHEQHVRPGVDPNHTAMYSHTREYLPMETRSRHKAYPSQETIDLTSSPRRPPFGNDGTMPMASQVYPGAGANNHAYAPEVPRHSPVKIDYYGHPVGARPDAYVSEQDRMYQRRAPPAHQYVPLRR